MSVHSSQALPCRIPGLVFRDLWGPLLREKGSSRNGYRQRSVPFIYCLSKVGGSGR